MCVAAGRQKGHHPCGKSDCAAHNLGPGWQSRSICLCGPHDRNRQKEVGLLASALVGSDFVRLRQLGHRMKGVGNSYGFALITLLGKRIEDFASSCDVAGVSACVAQYNDFLLKVSVTLKCKVL